MYFVKKTFDVKKYYDLQTKKIKDVLTKDYSHVYLEIGGKFFDDQHASRVLSGFEPGIKHEIIKNLEIDKEFIVCISSYTIKANKKRRDNKNTYTTECLDMVKKLENDGFKVSICVTRYSKCASVDSFINKVKKMKKPVYLLKEIEDYPYNFENVFAESGLKANDYIPVSKKLVCIIAPGPDSGKFVTAISQIYFDNYIKKKKSTYRKFETFLIPELSINNPLNLASSMAMCDVYGDDTIDENYFKKSGNIYCIDERDCASFKLLYKMMLEEEKKHINSFSEVMINSTRDCIFDLDGARLHAKKEIIRRYKEYKKFHDSGKISQIEFNEANRIYNLINSDDNELSKNEIKFFLNEAIQFWGVECQSNVCLEELGELIQAICKYRREGYEDAPEIFKEKVLEELADVHNMITQLEMYFGEEEVNKIRIQKIMRTKKLLKEEMLEEKGKKEA